MFRKRREGERQQELAEETARLEAEATSVAQQARDLASLAEPTRAKMLLRRRLRRSVILKQVNRAG
ncbi:MAG: hypothetical protein F4Z36_07565 [Acidimicrobiia bacterium]|nr:hypothetical protein [Acidimicrobiia bacterium]